MKRGVPGYWTRRACAWAFGEAPTQRFLDPWLADLQLEWVSRGGRARAALRARSLLELCRLTPSLVARAEAASGVGWAWPVALLLSVGVGTLASVSPEVARAQAVWALLGVCVLLVIRATGRFLRHDVPLHGGLVLVLAMLAIGPNLAGLRWVQLSSLHIWWAALSRPLLLVALGALWQRARRGGGPRAAWAAAAVSGAACAGCVKTDDPGSLAVTATMALAMGLAGGRAARLPTFAALGFASVCFWWSIPPWGPSWLPSADSDNLTDLVLAAANTRLGVAGVALALVASVAVALGPLRATRAPSAQLLARGFAVSQLSQVVLHTGAACGLLPMLELPLPGVSHGGSSLVALLATLGCLAAAERGSGAPSAAEAR